jgi:hypothetical protein
MRKPIIVTTVGLFAVLFSRCGAGDNVAGTRRAATIASVAVILSNDVLLLGDTASARIEARDSEHRLVQWQQATWTSDDIATAAVSIQGVVSGMGHGTTAISATVGEVTGGARVYVLDSTSAETQPPVKAELPRDSVSVAWRQPTGRTITVRQGDNLQRALNDARRGDEIVIDPGAEFRGNFVLPAKAGDASNGWITVRTAAMQAITPQGTRIDPVNHAMHMPKLVTSNDRAALATEEQASGWRIVGIEITVDPNFRNVQQGLVLLGDGSGAQRAPQQVPRDIILDRVYIHGQPNVNLKRCVALNSAYTAIVESQLLECHGKGFDSQSILGWNGPGPFLIANNRLEAAGEVIMFGGADPAIENLVPSDIVVQRNYLTRPSDWRGRWTVKNLFELKNAQRVLVEANVMQNNWADAQIGFAVVMGSADSGYPWCIVQDVTFQYNYIDNSAGGFQLFDRYGTAQQMRRIAVRHNLLTNIGLPNLGMNGRMFQLQGRIDDLAIENNTGFTTKIYITFGDGQQPMSRFSFRNNIGGDADYPVHGGRANGAQAMAVYTTAGSRFERNIIVTRMPPRVLPPNNSYVPARTAIGFNDGAPGFAAFKLARESSYFGSGTGGSMPGADIDGLAKRVVDVAGPGAPAAKVIR